MERQEQRAGLTVRCINGGQSIMSLMMGVTLHYAAVVPMAGTEGGDALQCVTSVPQCSQGTSLT